MNLPQAYTPEPCSTVAEIEARTYLANHVGQLVQPVKLNLGSDDTMVTLAKRQIEWWTQLGYPPSLIAAHMRWDYTNSGETELPLEFFARGEFEDFAQLIVRNYVEMFGATYLFPGLEAEKRGLIWPARPWKNRRAKFFWSVMQAMRAENQAPIFHASNGLMLDPRTTWRYAAERAVSWLEALGLNWLVVSGNKTPHFHRDGHAGQGFDRIPDWSLEEFWDASALFLLEVQKLRPGTRIVLMQMRQPGHSADGWLLQRGVVDNVWLHGGREHHLTPWRVVNGD